MASKSQEKAQDKEEFSMNICSVVSAQNPLSPIHSVTPTEKSAIAYRSESNSSTNVSNRSRAVTTGVGLGLFKMRSQATCESDHVPAVLF